MYAIVIKWVLGNLPKLIGAILISVVLYLGYAKIKDIGYQEATAEYTIEKAETQKLLNEKIDVVEKLALSLVSDNKKTNALLSSGISTILKSNTGKPLTMIKEGKCLPTETFSDTFVLINKRTNQAMLESRK